MIALTTEPIKPDELLAAIARPDCGGSVLFLGTVRDLTAGQKTLALEYEAHPRMAERELIAIADEAKARWRVAAVAIVHRLGKLAICDIAVAVAVSCPHRNEAFEAAHFVIDEVKRRVPIWKRDHSPDGATQWIHPDPVNV